MSKLVSAPGCRPCLFFLLLFALPAGAHHVLGRPSYSIGPDSTSSPAMRVETRIGDYSVNFVAVPAFPKPGAVGRLTLRADRIEGGPPFDGVLSFSVRDDRWFGGDQELIGRLPRASSDGVYRQDFVFAEAGDYLISARFESDGARYVIDFPLRVGDPVAYAPLVIALGLIGAVLIGVRLLGQNTRAGGASGRQ